MAETGKVEYSGGFRGDGNILRICDVNPGTILTAPPSHNPLSFHTHGYTSYVNNASIAPPSTNDIIYLLERPYKYFEIVGTLEGLYTVIIPPEFQELNRVLFTQPDQKSVEIIKIVNESLETLQNELIHSLSLPMTKISKIMDMYVVNSYIGHNITRKVGIDKCIFIFEVKFIPWNKITNDITLVINRLV
jgi:hypothetical protein